MADQRVTATFALPSGGTLKLRVRLKANELVGVYARGSIARVITRAVRTATQRGLKLGNCLRIDQHRGMPLYVYQLDNGGLS